MLTVPADWITTILVDEEEHEVPDMTVFAWILCPDAIGGSNTTAVFTHNFAPGHKINAVFPASSPIFTTLRIELVSRDVFVDPGSITSPAIPPGDFPEVGIPDPSPNFRGRPLAITRQGDDAGDTHPFDAILWGLELVKTPPPE